MFSFNRPSILLVVFLIAYIVSYSQEKANQAPDQNNFSLNPDNFRALQNSVNLFTGQVSFPMGLVSMPGRGGLNISVAIQYNSAGVKSSVDLDNDYSPTGILGLGWSMDLSKIVADHKQTGTRHDDDFYLVENGMSNMLICKSYYTSSRRFSTKNFNAWKIDYDPVEEKWVIIRENGFKYTYTAVQWTVKWGNWIGNSSQGDNQSRLAYVWSVSEVENLWGDKLTFQYDMAEEKVGTCPTCLNHTKAFYLKKVIDPVGNSVEFIYGDKTADEFKDTHTEQAEPDAYQEKFETLFLDELIIKSHQNITLYSVDLEYEIEDSEGIVKRYLKKIRKRFPSGESQPATGFEYFLSGDEKGCLKQVVNSLGAHIDYYYEDMVIPNSERDIDTDTGLDNPKVYVGGDYVIITTRFGLGELEDVTVKAYHWSGRWIIDDLWEIPGVTVSDYEHGQMVLGSMNFIYRVFSAAEDRHIIKAAHRKPYQAGEGGWETTGMGVSRTPGTDPNISGRAFAGDDFVGFIDRESPQFYLFTWMNDTWVPETINISDPDTENFFTAGSNFIFLHNDAAGHQDILHLYYLDAEKEWKESIVPTGLAFHTDEGAGADSHWYAANSFVVGLTQHNPEYIYMWDENYQNFSKVDILGGWNDASPVYISSTGQLGISSHVSEEGVSARFDGKNWYKINYTYEDYKYASYGEDYLVKPGPALSWVPWDFSPFPPSLNVLIFNPNTFLWEDDQKFNLGNNGRMNNQYGRAVSAGINMFLHNGKLYSKSHDNVWEFIGEIPLKEWEYLIGSAAFVLAPNYIVYDVSTTQSTGVQAVYILYLENNKIKNFERIGSRSAEKTSLSTLVLQVGLQSSLCRITGYKSSGNQSALVVKSTAWSDGNQLFETGYKYENGKMAADNLAQFNVATVIPGGTENDEPNGSTVYYFYNGLAESGLSIAPPVSNHGKENILIGLPYRIAINDKDEVQKSLTLNHYEIFSKSLNNSDNTQIDYMYYVRSVRTDQTMDGITMSVDNEYDADTGMLKKTMQRNSGALNHNEVITTNYTYWWEGYDADRSENILSPVIQAKRTSQVTGTIAKVSTTGTATKWIYYPAVNKYFPEMSYVWKHSGSPDFTAWSNAATPSNDWLRVSKVNKFEITDGTVFETEQHDGTLSTVIYDNTHTRPLARADFASHDQVAYSGFEDDSQGNWTYDNGLLTAGNVFTGSKSFQATSSAHAYISRNVPSGIYEVSYWSKTQQSITEADNGTVIHTANEEEKNGWTLTRSIVQISSGTGTIKIRVPANGIIDETRLKPQGAAMTTYVHNAVGNLLVETDTNLLQTSFEYDTQYRLSTIRDHHGKIVKTYNYHFRNE